MHQDQIDWAVARCTGESVGEIRRRGFRLIRPKRPRRKRVLLVRAPSWVDWDQLEAHRPA